MSLSSSDMENNSYQSDDSEWNYISGPYQIEKSSEIDEYTGKAKSSGSHKQDVGPYVYEPVADEDWLTKYREKKQTYDEHLCELQQRLDGSEELNKW